MKSLPPYSVKKTISTQSAFSMIELLVVIAIMAMLLGSSVVGLSSYQGQSFTKQAYDLREIIASAKTTAMAKNTFVWVGFGPSSVNGQKSLVVTAFASRSGLNDASASNLSQLMRPFNFQNFSLSKIGSMTGGPDQIGVDLSSTPSSWVLPAQKVDGTAVSLTQAILFSPTGQSFLTANPLAYIDIGMRPSQGTAKNDNNKAALQVSGLTSQVQLFRE